VKATNEKIRSTSIYLTGDGRVIFLYCQAARLSPGLSAKRCRCRSAATLIAWIGTARAIKEKGCDERLFSQSCPGRSAARSADNKRVYARLGPQLRVVVRCKTRDIPTTGAKEGSGGTRITGAPFAS